MIDNLKKFLNEDQDPKLIEKVAEKLKDFLMSTEEMQYIAVQKKPAVNLSPDCVAITNRRIIFCRMKNLGLSMEFQDYLWKDVKDCHLKEGILGAEFTLTTIIDTSNKIDFLPKSQARKLYSLAQEQEEIQAEIRRQMALEEKRAASGNMNFMTTIPENIPPKTEPQQDETEIALKKLKNLFENGLINQQEFESKKAEILARL